MREIKYVPKKYDSNWQKFGAPTRSEYEKWSPEVCGICCLKMIGDTYGSTTNTSLYQLTMGCKQRGGFRELPTGKIQGVFHQPLLELAKDYGLDGNIESDLDIKKVIASLQNGRFIILSLDKSKVNSKLKGGHLVLVYAYDPKSETFLINDPEPVLAKNGRDVKVRANRLGEISNKKGLVIYKQKDRSRL
ncbi:hypothetical protein COS31_00015 [Candidatus Roizmanbacteria bacterium CG02_land_8_20_14_3_00_36_15]|nr:MAG: hypothetical protein COS31_00015 [Candidatus Roizmanbacteria bacterium CG02_land_8_20_14_3_00_36_15]